MSGVVSFADHACHTRCSTSTAPWVKAVDRYCDHRRGLSVVCGKPFRIEKIRENREKPGLMRQHLTAVNAAATVCGATVEGAELHSRALTFHPAPIQPGDYHFDVGSAGSTTLVLQTILPALLSATSPS